MKLHVIGNAHLDPAWMWTWDEGMEAFLATCRSALDRMDETPEFVFTCSSAAHYKWVEDTEPDLFERIRQRVAEGRWAIAGGWWLQADCNLPSGEGFVRQALYGQRYFLEKFGRICRTGYSVDAFGHNAGLPQLLARAGMTGYIFCRPDPTELDLPSPLLRWYSSDGSSVLAYRVPFHYNMYESSVPKKLADIQHAYSYPTPLASNQTSLDRFGDTWAIFYGVGNHGGGPTKEHIAQLLAAQQDTNGPHILFSSPDQFFASVREQISDLPILVNPPPTWTTDLQLNAPGCYTAHSLIKKLNRRSEHALMQAETLSALATLRLGTAYPADELRSAWQNVCFNHFHDIICGVAIREACDDAIHQYGSALHTAATATRYAVQRLARQIQTTGGGQSLLVFNTHSFPITQHITFELWHDIDKSLWSQPINVRVTDNVGTELPVQVGFTSGKIGRDRIAITFPGEVPALGWNSYRVYYGEQGTTEPSSLHGSDTVLENDHLRLEFSPESGVLQRMLNKRTGAEYLSGASAQAIALEDRTDTWGHGVTRFDTVIDRFANADIRLVEIGDCYGTIRSTTRWRNCRVTQDFRLYSNAEHVEVLVTVDWNEPHTMLKLDFTINAPDPISIAETAYHTIRNTCDGTERPCGRFAGIVSSSDNTGIMIATDAKHGYSAEGNIFSLSVLRTPTYATHDPHIMDPNEDADYLDMGVQRFTYRILPYSNNIAQIVQASTILNTPLITHLESAHEGSFDRSYCGIAISSSAIQCMVIKQSEDSRGWVLRIWNTTSDEVVSTIELQTAGIRFESSFKSHEVQTWVIEGNDIREVDLVEM